MPVNLAFRSINFPVLNSHRENSFVWVPQLQFQNRLGALGDDIRNAEGMIPAGDFNVRALEPVSQGTHILEMAVTMELIVFNINSIATIPHLIFSTESVVSKTMEIT